jgi:hypothetical protein
METGRCLACLHHAGVILGTHSSGRRQGLQHRLVPRPESSGAQHGYAGAYLTSEGEYGNAAF